MASIHSLLERLHGGELCFHLDYWRNHMRLQKITAATSRTSYNYLIGRHHVARKALSLCSPIVQPPKNHQHGTQ